MKLDGLVAMARQLGASDLHLEPGQPATVRVKGGLRALEVRPDGEALREMARSLLDEPGWVAFQERRSADLSRVIERVRCRINLLHSARGVGLAVRLLSSFQPTLENLNLHADVGNDD
jgi:twitching motility protein PilT